MVTITAGRTGILVSGIGSSESKAQETGTRDRVEVFFVGTGAPAKISPIKSPGSYRGSSEVRDHVIEDLLKHVDTMAYTLATGSKYRPH